MKSYGIYVYIIYIYIGDVATVSISINTYHHGTRLFAFYQTNSNLKFKMPFFPQTPNIWGPHERHLILACLVGLQYLFNGVRRLPTFFYIQKTILEPVTTNCFLVPWKECVSTWFWLFHPNTSQRLSPWLTERHFSAQACSTSAMEKRANEERISGMGLRLILNFNMTQLVCLFSDVCTTISHSYQVHHCTWCGTFPPHGF